MAETVVSADWVAERGDGVVVVDVRDAWEYEGIGHIPGAVNIPFDRFRATDNAAERADGEDTPAGMLPDAAAFAAVLGEAGIAPSDHVVAYDDHHGVFAARLLVTLECFGHSPDRLHLLDGDFSAWQRERETSTSTPTVDPTTYETGPPAEPLLVTADEIAAAIDEPDVVLVDTREAWEFAEGHIPGAVRLDWRELVDDESRGLKAPATIEAILADRGITRARRVLLYCNTARRISHTYTVLRNLGYEDVGFYEGSLTEWEAAGRPMETD